MLSYLTKLISFKDPTWKEWIIYFGAFGILHIPGILNFYDNHGAENAYLKFAESLISGQLTLPEMDSYRDMISYEGEYFLPYPPFPSLLLLPFVFIFSVGGVNTVFIALLLSCLNLYLLRSLLLKLHVHQQLVPWLLCAFFFGTAYWFAFFTSHHVYSFAHIVSVSISLMVLSELFGRKRWMWVGVLIGLGLLTRQFTLFYMVLAVYQVFRSTSDLRKTKLIPSLVRLTAGFSIFAVVYLIYNYVRFGNPFDSGYEYIQFNGVLAERVARFGVFGPEYVPFNLYSFFLKGFDIEFFGKEMLSVRDVDLWGTSLLSSSPFLVAAFWARTGGHFSKASWLTILLMLVPMLFYHNNGYQQVNTIRFSLDFMPILFLLAASGSQSLPGRLFKGMIVYAIMLNVIAFTVHYFYQ